MQSLLFTSDTSRVRPDQLDGLPGDLPPEAQVRWLDAAHEAVVVYDRRTGQVAGFATAMTRGVRFSVISQLEVRPGYDHYDLEGELAARILARIHRN